MRPYIYIFIVLATYLIAYKLLFRNAADFIKRGRDMITIWPIVIIIYLIYPGGLTAEDYPDEFSWRIVYWMFSGLAVFFIVSRLIY